MAKTRSLPDKFYDKDYKHNGIHRVPLWRIAGYALNNTATNVYLMMMNYATYYLMLIGSALAFFTAQALKSQPIYTALRLRIPEVKQMQQQGVDVLQAPAIPEKLS